MIGEAVDPIIAELANPVTAARKAKSLVRYHRPVVESMVCKDGFSPWLEQGETLIVPYDIIFAAMDALRKRSIDPFYSRDLVLQVALIAMGELPAYEEMKAERIMAAEEMAADLTQRGKKVTITPL